MLGGALGGTLQITKDARAREPGSVDISAMALNTAIKGSILAEPKAGRLQGGQRKGRDPQPPPIYCPGNLIELQVLRFTAASLPRSVWTS
jgi:hypothetical protein